MPRILFVTSKIGFGHERVSSTLESAVKSAIPGCYTKTATYFDFFPPRFQKLINTIYIYGLRLFPEVFGYIYLTQKRYRGGGVNFWYRILGRRYADVIERFSPDLIVITQGLACQWLGRLKKKGLIRCALTAVITDFVVHPFWVSQEIDFYIVATEEMKKDLISRGISSEKIEVTGVPIDSRFNNAYDKNEISKKIGLKGENTKVLIMGGGWGLGKMDKVLMVIDRLGLPLELLVVTGRNRGLYRRLKNKRFNLPVHVYGKVDNISELMAVSDVIITKAGGVTVSELLASGLPAILWDIIPGQEEANADYLVNAGAAIKINNTDDIKDVMGKMVFSPGMRHSMYKNSKKMGKPNSAFNAVKYIERLINV